MLKPRCVCSGPVLSPKPEHGTQLHKANSLPVGIPLPGQIASPPPVKVPKGIRSNRLRKQGSSPATALTGNNGGQSPAKALGVKRNGGTSRVVKTSSVAQEEFIKVSRCPSSCCLYCSGSLGSLVSLGVQRICTPFACACTFVVTRTCQSSTSMQQLLSCLACQCPTAYPCTQNQSKPEMQRALDHARFACCACC